MRQTRRPDQITRRPKRVPATSPDRSAHDRIDLDPGQRPARDQLVGDRQHDLNTAGRQGGCLDLGEGDEGVD